MGVTVSQMAARTATVTFDYDGQSVTVVYSPEKINNEVIAQLDGNSESVAQAFATIIKSWDVMDDSVDPPVMFPLDVGRLKELGWPFRLFVRQAITQDIRPN